MTILLIVLIILLLCGGGWGWQTGHVAVNPLGIILLVVLVLLLFGLLGPLAGYRYW